jgi:hypothetical protein
LVSSPYLLGVAQGDLRQDGAGSEEPQGAQWGPKCHMLWTFDEGKKWRFFKSGWIELGI